MAKVIFTADTLLNIIRSVFDDEDLDTEIQSDKDEWNNKKLSEILNVDYYSYKHKAPSTSSIRDKLIAQDAKLAQVGMLDVLKRSFCLVQLDNVQRLYSKDIDQIGVEATLQYWLQAEKIKLLEALMEAANIALCGVKIPVIIDGESRRVTLFFGTVNASIDGQTEIGESAIASIKVTMAIMPNVANYSDYKVQFLLPKNENPEEKEYIDIPITNITFGSSMTPKTIPLMRDTAKVNNSNLSNCILFTLTFDGYIENPVIQQFTDDTLSKAALNIEEQEENNKIYMMKLTRLDKEYIYSLRLKDYKIITNNDTGNEAHVASLYTGE